MTNEQGVAYRYRTNLSNAYCRGIEWMNELHVHRALAWSSKLPMLSWLINATLLESRYQSTTNTSIDGKSLEYAPEINLRTGITSTWQDVRGSILVSHVGKQYADASNKEFDAAAASGVVPAYTVVDVIVGYTYDRYRFDLGINNVLDARYFTRRADGYPGPGIMPAEPRTVNASISVSL